MYRMPRSGEKVRGHATLHLHSAPDFFIFLSTTSTTPLKIHLIQPNLRMSKIDLRGPNRNLQYLSLPSSVDALNWDDVVAADSAVLFAER